MKLALALLTGITFSASLPALADSGEANQNVTVSSANQEARGPGWHRGPGWRHGGWHRSYPCGPFGLFRCGDVNAETQPDEAAE